MNVEMLKLKCTLFPLVLLVPVAAMQTSAWGQVQIEPESGSATHSVQVGNTAPAGPAVRSHQAASESLIAAGDLLEVSVFGSPDYVKDVRVSGSGEISLPMLNSVNVGGLSTNQAELLLAKAFADGQFFNDPRVSVFIKETQGVSVLGEVQKPGIYQLGGGRGLLDAISAAGGTTPKAGKVVTITRHDHPQTPETVTLAFDANGSAESNVPVGPGDTVVVAKAGTVYVVGDVHRPSGISMENSEITVLQAIAEAEGTNPSASLGRAKLIRKTANGPREVPVDLKKILQSKAPDLQLQPGDILFIPSSTAKNAGRRGIEAILQTVSGLAIYGRL